MLGLKGPQVLDEITYPLQNFNGCTTKNCDKIIRPNNVFEKSTNGQPFCPSLNV